MQHLSRSIAQGPFFILAFVALATWCLAATRDYMAPIALAVLAWFLINGLTAALLRWRPLSNMPRGLARALAVTILFGSILAAAQGVAISLSGLTEQLTLYGNPLFLKAWYWLNGQGLSEHLTKEALFRRFAGEGGIEALLDMARSAISTVSMIFLYTLFLLVDDRYFLSKLKALAPEAPTQARLRTILAEIGRETGVYLWLMTLVSAGVGLTTFAVCWTLGIKGAGLWGFIAFGLNYIPTIGSLMGVAIPVGFAALTTGDPATVLVALALLGTTQFIAGELVVPRLMGDRMNLSTFVILLSLVAWGAIWGPTGMFLAVPIMVIAVMIFAKFESTRPIAIALSKTGEVPQPEWWRADREFRVDPETGEVVANPAHQPASPPPSPAPTPPTAPGPAGPSVALRPAPEPRPSELIRPEDGRPDPNWSEPH